MSTIFDSEQSPPKESDKFAFLNLRLKPGKVDYRRAGYILECEPVAIRALVSLGLLKPLGNNSGTEHKYFLTKTIVQYANDEKWMERAAKAIQNHWSGKNSRRKTGVLNPSRIRRRLEQPVAAGV
jgi:hypothetical protein